MLTLITGGARSGKSRHALELAESCSGSNSSRAFIATAQAIDDEMRRRIADHQNERRGAYQTIEEPIELAAALDAVPAETEVAIVDCLTLWMGNLVFRAEQGQAEQGGAPLETEMSALPAVRDFLKRLDAGLPYHLLVVTNELGMGLVPADPMSRAFRDLAGRLNQEVARRADRVILMVSGLPLSVRGDER